jgi:ferredoxin-thioredoxin reductase catalytic subunit
MDRAGHVESVGKKMKPCRVLGGKPEGTKEITVCVSVTIILK